MRRQLPLAPIVIASALLLGACNGSAATATPPPVATAAPTTPTSVATVPASSVPEQSAVSTSIDPCQLVTAAEASSLAGTTFGAGTEGTTSGGSKTCVYGAQTLNVFNVVVAQASDATSAQADWAQEEANAEALAQKGLPSGVSVTFNLTDVSNVTGADRAAVGTAQTTIAGQTVSLSAIYFLKGADFVTFSDLVLGGAAPTASALEMQAVTTIGRLP